MIAKARKISPEQTAQIDANLRFAKDFLERTLNDPEFGERIPDGAAIVFIPDDDPELARRNTEMALAEFARGRNVYLQHTVAHNGNEERELA